MDGETTRIGRIGLQTTRNEFLGGMLLWTQTMPWHSLGNGSLLRSSSAVVSLFGHRFRHLSLLPHRPPGCWKPQMRSRDPPGRPWHPEPWRTPPQWAWRWTAACSAPPKNFKSTKATNNSLVCWVANNTNIGSSTGACIVWEMSFVDKDTLLSPTVLRGACVNDLVARFTTTCGNDFFGTTGCGDLKLSWGHWVHQVCWTKDNSWVVDVELKSFTSYLAPCSKTTAYHPLSTMLNSMQPKKRIKTMQMPQEFIHHF